MNMQHPMSYRYHRMLRYLQLLQVNLQHHQYNDHYDYGFDDDEFLKEQEVEQKKKKSKESI